MGLLEKTVTVRVKVDSRIADLVYFIKDLRGRHGPRLLSMEDEELIEAAESFWDSQHGED